MEEYFAVLTQCPLFTGITAPELSEMLRCLNGRVVHAAKGSPVFLEGDPAEFVGVVLSGSVQVIRDDFYGNRSVLTAVAPGGLFGEAFACADLEALPVSVIAQQYSTVLLLDCKRVLSGCSGACGYHSILVRNLLRGIAQKNLALTRKIRCMSRKTTREILHLSQPSTCYVWTIVDENFLSTEKRLFGEIARQLERKKCSQPSGQEHFFAIF